jgi:hypothetical protein
VIPIVASGARAGAVSRDLKASAIARESTTVIRHGAQDDRDHRLLV